jgi:hypothetical protein
MEWYRDTVFVYIKGLMEEEEQEEEQQHQSK